ncbi:hypothetical protein CPC08DRAFT_776584 [Agrocybe pediades]|nr:hypothetical protein CPC08DRAFT_776584 [Agrocybe pediades]
MHLLPLESMSVASTPITMPDPKQDSCPDTFAESTTTESLEDLGREEVLDKSASLSDLPECCQRRVKATPSPAVALPSESTEQDSGEGLSFPAIVERKRQRVSAALAHWMPMCQLCADEIIAKGHHDAMRAIQEMVQHTKSVVAMQEEERKRRLLEESGGDVVSDEEEEDLQGRREMVFERHRSQGLPEQWCWQAFSEMLERNFQALENELEKEEREAESKKREAGTGKVDGRVAPRNLDPGQRQEDNPEVQEPYEVGRTYEKDAGSSDEAFLFMRSASGGPVHRITGGGLVLEYGR